jgi:hypothetical protein
MAIHSAELEMYILLDSGEKVHIWNLLNGWAYLRQPEHFPFSIGTLVISVDKIETRRRVLFHSISNQEINIEDDEHHDLL